MSYLAECADASLLCLPPSASPTHSDNEGTASSDPPPMAARWLPTLPPEIVVRILQHIIDVAPASPNPNEPERWVRDIMACGLVNNAWAALARAFLFRRFVVTDGSSEPHTEARGCSRDFSVFVHILKQPQWRPVRYCIRELALRADWNLIEMRYCAGMNAPTVSNILQQLENLNTLDISGLPFAPSGTAMAIPVDRGLGATLERLRIADVRAWKSFGREIYTTLGLFSMIEDLVLDGIGELKDSVFFEDGSSGFTDDMISAMNLDMSRGLSITHLTMNSVAQMHFFFKALALTGSASTLRTLSVSCSHAAYVPGFANDLSNFLSTPLAAQKITTLGIELADCFRTGLPFHVAEDVSRLTTLLLPALSNLRSLQTFGVLIMFPHDPWSPRLLWHFVCAALARLPRATTRVQLCLHMDAWSAQPSEAAPFEWDAPWLAPQLDWEQLRRSLERLHAVEVVRFLKRFSGKGNNVPSQVVAPWVQEQACIAAQLPELEKAGRLFFDLE